MPKSRSVSVPAVDPDKATPDPLQRYRDKRDFTRTPEPEAGGDVADAARSFVIQKHWASHLHYDFRLELDGTMKSWAVPKGPSLDTHVKRMAVEVEDHPIAYSSFEGEIPAKQYGAGHVIIWDRGTWTPIGDPVQGYRDGNLKFTLDGEKLHGKWVLIRMKGKGEKQPPWLLIKERDDFVRSEAEYSIVDALPDSVGPAGPAKKGSRKTAVAKQIASPASSKSSARSASAASSASATPSARFAKPARPPTLAMPAAAATAAPKPRRGRILMPQGAVPAALPSTLTPQLATLVAVAPDEAGEWSYEIKFDGYRVLARIEDDAVTLITRNGKDWSARMPAIVAALRGLKLANGWIDGEIVMLDAAGLPDFQALQNAFDNETTGDIVFYAFDLPWYDGFDLRAVPLEARRALLQTLVDRAGMPAVRFSESFDLPAQALLQSACGMGLEGIIGKRRLSHYSGKRSADWIKLKCQKRQEFVIGGYTDPKGSRAGFGALLLGVHDASGALVYAGNVGTGFTDASLARIKKVLVEVAADTSPFQGGSVPGAGAHWVRPELVAEVAFADWTSSGRLRHAVFHGLRTDKAPAAISREDPAPPQAVKPSGAPKKAARISIRAAPVPALPPSFRITHPDKIVDLASGATKRDVLQYYARVGHLMMPHLLHRPVALVRAPDGVGGPVFFQKHADGARIAGIDRLDPALDPGHAPLLAVASADGLLAAAQLNVIEFHTWNALADAIDKPDRMTFDLDPGEGVSWRSVQESAVLVRELLAQLGLASFVKTSGGKGLHVVTPLKRRHDFATVKAFSHAIVDHLAATIPQRFVAKSGPANRVGKIFVDYLRNGVGATTACAWSLRVRPGLGVSVPIDWNELDGIAGGDHWKIDTIDARIDTGDAAWKGYAAAARTLTAAMKTLGFKP